MKVACVLYYVPRCNVKVASVLYYASRRNVKVACVLLLCFLGVLNYLNKPCVCFLCKISL